MKSFSQLTNEARAIKGGQVGANGEWYKGGAFVATTSHPKGAPRKKVKPSGKQEVENYKWMVPPMEDTENTRYMAIRGVLGGVEVFDRQSNTFSLNTKFGMNDTEHVKYRQHLIDAWNKGARWREIDSETRQDTGRLFDIHGKEMKI